MNQRSELFVNISTDQRYNFGTCVNIHKGGRLLWNTANAGRLRQKPQKNISRPIGKVGAPCHYKIITWSQLEQKPLLQLCDSSVAGGGPMAPVIPPKTVSIHCHPWSQERIIYDLGAVGWLERKLQGQLHDIAWPGAYFACLWHGLQRLETIANRGRCNASLLTSEPLIDLT